MGWKKPSLDAYLESKEKAFYESLHNYLIKKLNLTVDDVYNFLRINFNSNPNSFSAYSLIEEQAYEKYIEWKKKLSSKSLYFNEVKKSFTFIVNFCISNNITFENYKNKYSIKHIREEKIDYSVAVFLNLIDRRKLKKVEKIILKKYLTQYNIIYQRIFNPELNQILNDSFLEMTNLLKELNLLEENKVNQVQ